MPKYKLVLERLLEEVIEIDAETEDEAYNLVLDGHGELADMSEWRPTLVSSEEIPDDSSTDRVDSGTGSNGTNI